MDTLFNWLTHFGYEAALFIISMVPVVELRGAVILGAAAGLPWLKVFIICVIGNMVPVPFLLFFGRKVLGWLKTVPLFARFANWYEAKIIRQAQKIKTYTLLGLFILVAIPLPGTGAWTGVLAATFLELKPKDAFWMIFLGVVTAGIIMCIGSYGLIGALQLF